ncbi:MAG TPA: helix-turn-helix transcriptional regulator [Gelidibacter sp.]|uniref:helix-turn-helix domain-containing protein n=1 Tax=Gelidibacter sp. TaxID=2018083 RepID=UPI002CC0513A|nr:helix-turn-helix transcriptional regulator [Gelidibacter sp.]HXJ97907.1 helix-turn-helix transcriptional regulator [Gelidibacter sp.]
MLNNDDFSKRLQKVIDFYAETASSFSDKIGVQRSSISHILSGRNKPSLDFVMKILSAYPEVDLYWLLNGQGKFPAEQQKSKAETKQDFETPIPSFENKKEIKSEKQPDTKDKTIDKIVILYKDGTFREFVES